MKHNEENERIKRAYRLHLKAARGLYDASIDVATAAIHRFEESTAFRSFKKFHFEQAIAFRRRLDDARNERTGKPISKATALQVLNALRASFFGWRNSPVTAVGYGTPTPIIFGFLKRIRALQRRPRPGRCQRRNRLKACWNAVRWPPS